MNKRLITTICIILVCALLLQFAYETKVKAAEPITLTAIGIAGFALIAAACGYTVLKRVDLDKMYESFMKYKGNALNFNEKVRFLLATGVIAGKIVMDKANDAVSAVIDFFNSLSFKNEAGVQTVDVNPQSVKIINEPIVADGMLFSIDIDFAERGKTIPLLMFGDNNQFVLELDIPAGWLNPIVLKVNGKSLNNGIQTKYGLVDEPNNFMINHLSYEILSNDVFEHEYLKIKYQYSADCYTSSLKTRSEWRYSSNDIKTDYIKLSDLLDYDIPDDSEPMPTDIYVSPNALHLGHDICADINSPTIPLLGIDEGIRRIGDELVWEGGNIDDFIDYLTTNTDIWDRVADYVVGNTIEAIDALPVVVPEVNTEAGTISWEATDAIDPSIPDVQNPDIPIIWQDLFKSGTKTIDFSPFYDIGLSERFPFCVPFDLVNSIKTLKATPKAPRWVANIKGVDLVIDFSRFEHLASIVRWFMLFLFIVVLIMISRRMIGGE